MKRDPITVRPDTPLLEAQHLFVEAAIGGAPVVDASGVVRGFLSRSDLLDVIDQMCDEDRDPGEDGDVVEHLHKLTVLDVAAPDPIWVAPDTTVAEVAQRMRAAGIQRVLVGTDGRVAGILTAFDLLQAVRA